MGVDRLDYSKGLEERFLGFERFLADNPDLRREVLMLQIAPVSREEVDAYQEIRGRLDALSRPHQRRVRRRRLGADPLCEPELSRATSWPASIARPRVGAGDAAARRHEPGGQGISSPPRTRTIPAC